MLSKRHLVRKVVMQVLFVTRFSDKSSKKYDVVLFDDLAFEYGFSQVNLDYARSLLDGILKNTKLLDEKIKMHAPSFPLDKIAKIDLSILRLGTYELIHGEKYKIPKIVAINEAIELAKEFGGEKSAKFVNAVLNAIMKENSY